MLPKRFPPGNHTNSLPRLSFPRKVIWILVFWRCPGAVSHELTRASNPTQGPGHPARIYNVKPTKRVPDCEADCASACMGSMMLGSFPASLTAPSNHSEPHWKRSLIVPHHTRTHAHMNIQGAFIRQLNLVAVGTCFGCCRLTNRREPWLLLGWLFRL